MGNAGGGVMHRGSLLGPIVALSLVACGGAESSTSDGIDDGSTDGEVDGGRRARDSGGDATPDVGRDTLLSPDTYVDPGCGDATPPPIEAFDCDPFGGKTACPSGEACDPYVLPADDPCSPETYGATCEPAGTGTEDAPCDDGTSGCAAGFFCVVSGGGNVCAQVCKIGVPGACPEGLVCEPTDVTGVGACI